MLMKHAGIYLFLNLVNLLLIFWYFFNMAAFVKTFNIRLNNIYLCYTLTLVERKIVQHKLMYKT